MTRGAFRFPVLTIFVVFVISLVKVFTYGNSREPGPPPSPTLDSATAVPNAFFGVGVNRLARTFPLHGGIEPGTLGKLAGAGWKYIEPSHDCGPDPNTSCYSWGNATGGILGWVAFAQVHRAQLVYDFGSMPAWLCPQNSSGSCTALPTDLTWVANFATALATKFRGKIKYYETYNEVDSLAEWTDTCSNLVLFHNTIYNSIKAVDPNAMVGAPNVAVQSTANSACASIPTPSGTPSDSSIWLQNFLQTKDRNGNLPAVDTVGVHTYGPFSYVGCSDRTNPPCYAPMDYGCDWRVSKLHCAAQPLLNLYHAFRTVMNNNNLSSKPLLVTEGGFGRDLSQEGWCPSSSRYFSTACLSPKQQVAYIGRWLVLSASTWSDGGGQLPNWYSYDNNWGTLDGTNGMNAQDATAYGQMESWLKGSVFQRECYTGTPSTVFVCDFLNETGQQAQIVFNDNNSSIASYTPPAWATSYQGLLGRTASISGGSITVGDTPILLIGNAAGSREALISGVVNSASFEPSPLAAGTLFTIFGSNLAPVVARGQFPLPGQLAGVSVAVNGFTAPLLYVSPEQIIAQIPYGLPPGPAFLVFITAGFQLAPVNIQIADISPALFMWSNSPHAAVENQDYSLNSRSQPVRPGGILLAYFTGQGALDPPLATGTAAPFKPLARVLATTTATIGGQSAKVLFSGMTPGIVGVAQAEIVVPELPPGDHPLVLTVGGVQTGAGLVSIGPAH
jgi:uncharacterized protein (TIGR03437 family)